MASTEREALWKERIAHWRESGLSQRAYALQHGYPIRQVGYWVRRLAAATPTAALVPVKVKGTPVAPALVLRGAQGWSIELPAATPADWLADLLRSL